MCVTCIHVTDLEINILLRLFLVKDVPSVDSLQLSYLRVCLSFRPLSPKLSPLISLHQGTMQAGHEGLAISAYQAIQMGCAHTRLAEAPVGAALQTDTSFLSPFSPYFSQALIPNRYLIPSTPTWYLFLEKPNRNIYGQISIKILNKKQLFQTLKIIF